MRKNKKQIIITISLIIILILAVIGVSYAAFSYVGRGEKVNQITTGTISMDYSESDNVISINNALPTTDETGKVRPRDGEYFDFSVTTNLSGEAIINYEIAAEDFEDNTFDGSNVKSYLTKLVGSEEVEVSSNLPAVYNEKITENKKTGRPANMMSLLTGSTSTQGEETTNYRLRLYVDEEYNPQGDRGNLVFKTRINVYGKVSTEAPVPVLAQNWYSTFHSNIPVEQQEYYINKVSVVNTLADISTSLFSIDVSEEQNGRVMAYIRENGTASIYDSDLGGNKDVDAYQIVIGAKSSEVYAPENSSKLFYLGDRNNINTIDLQYLNTSNVTDMSYMFYGCYSLEELNLSNFKTSNVTNMSNMFESGMFLVNYDFKSFDMTNVVNTDNMFPAHRIIDYHMYVDIS